MTTRIVLLGGIGLLCTTILFFWSIRDTYQVIRDAGKEVTSDSIPHIPSSTTQTNYQLNVASTTYAHLLFVGDVMLGRHVEVLSYRHGFEFPYQGFPLKAIASSTAIIANFESAMATPHIPTPAFHMRFSTTRELLPAFAEAGFTHASLANNHAFDFGLEGYQGAVMELRQHGIQSYGTPETVNKESIAYIESVAGRVALVGINAVFSAPSPAKLAATMEIARAESDIQIITIHWGEEYVLTHNQFQESLATTLIGLGADLIIGHHPHVVQDVRIIDGVVVFYSLGNYIFDQYFSDDVTEGMIVQVSLEDIPAARLIPVESRTVLSQPRPISSSETASFLKKLATRSDPLLYENIVQGSIPLNAMVATSPKTAMMGI